MSLFWEPFITAKPTTDAEGMTAFTIEYRKDAMPTITQSYRIDSFTLENLKNLVRSKCDALNAATDPATVVTGKIDTTIVPPVIDAAAVAWRADYQTAQQAKLLVDLGVIPANNAKYVALLAKLKTNFLPAYINLV